jgi:hypothetical protein
MNISDKCGESTQYVRPGRVVLIALLAAMAPLFVAYVMKRSIDSDWSSLAAVAILAAGPLLAAFVMNTSVRLGRTYLVAAAILTLAIFIPVLLSPAIAQKMFFLGSMGGALAIGLGFWDHTRARLELIGTAVVCGAIMIGAVLMSL